MMLPFAAFQPDMGLTTCGASSKFQLMKRAGSPVFDGLVNPAGAVLRFHHSALQLLRLGRLTGTMLSTSVNRLLRFDFSI